jgi:hypothetical protein
MYPRYPMIQSHFLPSIILNCIFMLIVLAGWVFFLVTAWRFTRAHESIASALATIKDASINLKPKE